MSEFLFEPVSFFEYSTLQEAMPFWVTQTSNWTRVIEKSFPHIKGYLVSDSRIIDNEASFLPVYHIKKPFNRHSWVSIPYATISEPILRKKTKAEMLYNSLFQYTKQNDSHIEIRSTSKLEHCNHFTTCTEYVHHQINLCGDEQDMFQRLHKSSVQVPIRKAMESGITLKIGSGISDVMEFYRIYVLARKEQGLPPQPFCFFKNMWNELHPINKVELLMVEKEGKVIAGLWSLKNRWLYCFEYLARVGKNDKLYCAHFLFWHGIKRALNDGLQSVSFARTSVRNTGLDQFKRRWGTEVIPYYDLIYPPPIVRNKEDRFSYKIIKKYAQLLPVPLFRYLGDIIYKLI